MTNRSLFVSACLAALAAALAGAGCGGTSGLSCDPACPSGFACTASGCVGMSPSFDMTAPTPGDMAGVCDPACGGATPHCNARGLCVACIGDGD